VDEDNTPRHSAAAVYPFRYYARLARLQQYVLENLQEPISLALAASVVGLEKSYFSTFFREKVGITFSDWLRQVRVQQAVELIRSQNTSLTQVAYSVGFQESRTFQRAFKRYMGITASAFRRTIIPDS